MSDCPSCSKSFDNSSNMKRHHAQAHNESIAGYKTTCENCDSEIVKEKKANAEGNSFCDLDCYGEWESENLTNENHPNWSGGDITIVCPICGDNFQTNKAESKRRTTCSEECRRKYLSDIYEGENNPNWSGGYEEYYGSDWPKMKNKVVIRDNNECQNCGKQGREVQLPVHHIKPVKSFEDPNDAHKMENMIQLCRVCHPKIEKLEPVEQKKRLK